MADNIVPATTLLSVEHLLLDGRVLVQIEVGQLVVDC